MSPDVKSLLIKRDYITRLQKTEDGCIITYPHPKLLYKNKPFPRLIEYISIERGDNSGFWVSTSYDDDDVEERFIPIPEYAMRLYIICEIQACNNSIPVNPSVMMFVDENNHEVNDIADLLEDPKKESEEDDREGFLYGLVIEARNDGFPSEYEKVAQTHKVEDGYNLIRKFYE